LCTTTSRAIVKALEQRKRLIVAFLKIIVTFYQIMSSMPFILSSVPWPKVGALYKFNAVDPVALEAPSDPTLEPPAMQL
jgi:hypothetical protein